MLYVITSKKLCNDDFLARIEEIAMSHPDRVILREKQMTEDEYRTYAYDCQSICRLYDVPFSVNGFINIDREIHSDLHVSFEVLQADPALVQEFRILGVSVHSSEEAKEAERLGASYLIAGHIYETDCKRGMPPRGLDFLQQVAYAVSIPVLAVGGITKERLPYIYANGAAGACVMSTFMQSDINNIANEVFQFKSIFKSF